MSPPDVVVLRGPLKACRKTDALRQACRRRPSRPPKPVGQQRSCVGLQRPEVSGGALREFAQLVVEVGNLGLLQFLVDLVKQGSEPRHRRTSCNNCLRGFTV